MRRPVVLVAILLGLVVSGVSGACEKAPCDPGSQTCVEQSGPGGSGFVCQCREDHLLNASGMCVPVPESQRIYVMMFINVTGVDTLVLLTILQNFSIPENFLASIFSSIPDFKTVKFLQIVSRPAGEPRPVQFSLLFTAEVTSQIQKSVARVLVEIERQGRLTILGATFGVVGHSAIFASLNNMDSFSDDLDWCSHPDLISCREHTTCTDVSFRYECPCDEGYIDKGDYCLGATISGPSQPFDTDGSRPFQLSCDPGNVTLVTSLEWENVTCDSMADGVFRRSICNLHPKPKWDDGRVVTCTAFYSDGSKDSSSFTIELNYPPDSSPIIEGYESGDVIHTGDRLKMTCSVGGGKPFVTSVDFSCTGHPDEPQDDVKEASVTSTLTINPLTDSDDGAECICKAIWKNPRYYTGTASRILKVNQKDDDSDSKLIIIIVSAVCGGVVIVVIIVALIVCKKRGETRDHGDGMFERECPYSVPDELRGSTGPYTALGDSAGSQVPKWQGQGQPTAAHHHAHVTNLADPGKAGAGGDTRREGSGFYNRVIPNDGGDGIPKTSSDYDLLRVSSGYLHPDPVPKQAGDNPRACPARGDNVDLREGQRRGDYPPDPRMHETSMR